MLQKVLTLFQQQQNVALSREAIGAQLDLPPAMVAQLLYTLVQRGRLVEVDEACRGCDACPLHRLCAGVPVTTGKGYALAPDRAIITPDS